MSVLEIISQLTKIHYPTGRAFKMPSGGPFSKLHTALNQSEARAVADALSILDSALPDNDNFTSEDATAWERRLGLTTNILTPLADRKAAIIRKMNHPGEVKARQHYLYLQGQLQAAGFDVYVYENRFATYPTGYTTMAPEDFSILPYPRVSLQHRTTVQHGQNRHGGNLYANKVVNHLLDADDYSFLVTPNLRSSFYIGGPYPGEWADVDATREQEFRQLILRIKPCQTVAFLLINFV